MATPGNEMKTKPSWRRYEDGNQDWESWTDKIFAQDTLPQVSDLCAQDPAVPGQLSLG